MQNNHCQILIVSIKNDGEVLDGQVKTPGAERFVQAGIG
jgi:hypothetical protein